MTCYSVASSCKANVTAIRRSEYAVKRGESKPTATIASFTIRLMLFADISLYEHQRRGVAWLQSLFEDNSSGCILADDMGLGKIIQLLTFIIHHFEVTPKAEQKPVLVLAPVSLLQNWQNELCRFFENSPVTMQILHEDGLKSVRYSRDDLRIQGLAEQGLYNVLKDGWRTGNIVLTTYDTLRSYQFSLAREKWFCVICDEAQRIKNPSAMVTQAVKAVGSQSDFCIACTGTPVENCLADLWCLFDFVQPGFLGSLNKDFGPTYQRPIEQKREGYEEVSEKLRKKIDPFVLRRLKEDVAKDLPPKNELSPEIKMNDLQKELYQEAISEYKHSINRAARERVRTNPVLTLLRDLRMICAIPVIGATSDALAESPKMLWLKQKLQEIRDKNEKVIVFTEFRAVQRAVKLMLKECFNLDATIINGETSTSSKKGMTRQGFIDEFQNKEGFNVIILSTTAVGFGVNIQKANHVIHFTRSWNPAKEDQATDRAYRIGQKKTVYVYYPTMISNEYKTFEANIDALLKRKRELAKDMLAVDREITADELMSTLGASSGKVCTV